MEGKLKFAMIGCRGHWNSYVFGGIRNGASVDLAAVCGGGDDPAPLKNAAAKSGFQPVVYDDWKKMLADVKPDLVCIDGPFELHAEMAAQALANGSHVFCEKPIALALEQLDRLEDVWRKSGKHIRSMVGLRYNPAFLHAFRLVQAGAVGKIKLIRTQKSYKLGQRKEFYKKRATYGGTIPWVGSHALDWLLYYTGERFEQVTAYHDAEDNNNHGDLEVAGHCLFRMSGGIIADAGVDYLRPAAAPSHGDDRVRIAGTRGVVEVMGGKVHIIDSEGERVIEPPPADRDVFSDFTIELTTGRRALVTDEETFALTRAVLLARESADTGKTIIFTGAHK